MDQLTRQPNTNTGLAGAGGKSTASPLLFLDGMRGLAALYVVFCHLGNANIPHRLSTLLMWPFIGRIAVGVFIVLSGYCLMLPVAASPSGELRGGTSRYLTRRAWRILPPYYAALILATPIAWLHLRDHGNAHLLPISFLAHLFMVHNFLPWTGAIDGPMWSVGTEWQIYFLLPLLLLPVWRKFGIYTTLIVGVVLGLLPHYLLPARWSFDCACPWYLGLFCLGMLGAVVTERPSGVSAGAVPTAAWGGSAAVAWVGAFSYCHHSPLTGTQVNPLPDLLIGFAALCTIIYCARMTRQDQASVGTFNILRLFCTPFALWVGTFSYSLYLTHELIYITLGWFLSRHIHNMAAQALSSYIILLPVMLAFGYLFFTLFERPFLVRRKQEPTREVALDAALSPAP